MLKERIQRTGGSEAKFVREFGYEGCVALANGLIRVVLEPNLGGRVLSCCFNGIEALYRDPSQDGLIWDGQSPIAHPCGGRCDIGPEFGGVRRDEFWLGRWKAEITGQFSARLTSPVSCEESVQLVREFELPETGAFLRFRQTIRNLGEKPLRTFHWSRTFVPGGGIALAPLPEAGRFPRGYGLGGPPGIIDFQPSEEPNIRIREAFLEIAGPPSRAKVVLDAGSGWLAYLSQAGLLFVKTFSVFPDRAYGELAANNASIWYSGESNSVNWLGPEYPVEIEPIGPLEILQPGEEAAFSEDWHLSQFPFPADRRVNLDSLRARILPN